MKLDVFLNSNNTSHKCAQIRGQKIQKKIIMSRKSKIPKIITPVNISQSNSRKSSSSDLSIISHLSQMIDSDEEDDRLTRVSAISDFQADCGLQEDQPVVDEEMLGEPAVKCDPDHVVNESNDEMKENTKEKIPDQISKIAPLKPLKYKKFFKISALIFFTYLSSKFYTTLPNHAIFGIFEHFCQPGKWLVRPEINSEVFACLVGLIFCNF